MELQQRVTCVMFRLTQSSTEVARGHLTGLAVEQTSLRTTQYPPPPPVPQHLGIGAYLSYTKFFCKHSKQANVFTKQQK